MIVIDSSAWIEYFTDSKNADYIEKLLDEEETITPSVVLIELSCKSARERWNFLEYLRFIKSKSSIIGMKEETIIKCGKIYAEERKTKSSFSMMDAVIVSIAKQNNSNILTKDNHFKDFKEVILLK